MLQIDNQVVKSLDKLTILVVNIDEKLTFIEHIKDINRKASQKEGVLLRLHNLIPCTAKLQLYKFAILPHLTYCDIVWHFCKSSDKFQRAAFKSSTKSYSVLSQKAGLPSLHQR